jgi:hypothetical protein
VSLVFINIIRLLKGWSGLAVANTSSSNNSYQRRTLLEMESRCNRSEQTTVE